MREASNRAGAWSVRAIFAAVAAATLGPAPAVGQGPPGDAQAAPIASRAPLKNLIVDYERLLFVDGRSTLAVYEFADERPFRPGAAPAAPHAVRRENGGTDAVDLAPLDDPDSFLLVKRSGELQIRDVADVQAVRKTLRIDAQGVASVAAWDGTIALVGPEGRVVLISSDSLEKTAEFQLAGLVGPPTFSVEGELAAYPTANGLAVFDVAAGKILATLPGVTSASVAISSRRGLVAAFDERGALVAYDLARSEFVGLPQAAGPNAWWIATFVDRDETLLLLGRDGLGLAFDVASRTLTQTFVAAPAGETTSVHVDPRGALAFVRDDGRVLFLPDSPSRRHARAERDGPTAAPTSEPYTAPEPNPPPSSAPASADRNAVDETNARDVTIWFATNRAVWAVDRSLMESLFYTLLQLDFLIAIVVVVVAAALIGRFGQDRRLPWIVIGATLPLVLLLAVRAGGWYQKPVLRAVPGARFSNDVASDFRWGRCVVSVPRDREVGEVPEPTVVLGVGPAATPGEHFILVTERDATLAEVAAENANANEVLVFVHGFNVGFEACAKRAAQLHVDLEIAGPTFFFSWPSHGREGLYFWDGENAKLSATPFRRMIDQIAEALPTCKIHVVAHSMGTRVVMNALARSFAEGKPIKVSSLVLAAPDIDEREFNQDMKGAVEKLALPLTLYVSATDQALALSRRFNNNQRLGDALPKPIVAPGMETIDASLVSLDFLGHGYFGDSPRVLKDLTLLIKEGRLAERRDLELKRLDDRAYWMLPATIAESNGPPR